MNKEKEDELREALTRKLAQNIFDGIAEDEDPRPVAYVNRAARRAAARVKGGKR